MKKEHSENYLPVMDVIKEIDFQWRNPHRDWRASKKRLAKALKKLKWTDDEIENICPGF